MRFFELNFATVILRFYLMMAVVIGGFFIGQYWIAAFALPIFLSVMLGARFQRPKVDGKVVSRRARTVARERAA